MSSSSLMTSRPEIGNPSLGFQQALQDMERNQWEQEQLKELETEMKDVNKALHERVYVRQTYDKKLNWEEKE